MLRHYLELKEQYPDALLFYRMGDFYEMFFEDAQIAAPVLEVVLTARHKGAEHETPMCGVPHHALETYVGKALRAGFKVAICEQMEDPAKAKGLVRREVIRVVTPGTLSEPALLEGKEANLLAALVWKDGQGAGAFLDISTGEFFLRRWNAVEAGVDDLEILRPREVVFEEDTLPESLATWMERSGTCRSPLSQGTSVEGAAAGDVLRRQLGVATLSGFGLEDSDRAVVAAAAALMYARDTQKNDLAHIKNLKVREADEAPVVDSTTLANLDVFRNQREGTRTGTLLSVLDRTTISPGGRLLKTWLRWPLRSVEPLEQRHSAVDELLEKREVRSRIRELLPATGDPERMVSRAVLGSLMPKEAAALREGLRTAPDILGALSESDAEILREAAGVDPLPGLLGRLEEWLEENPAPSLKDGGVIAAGVHKELDECRDLARDSKRHVLALEKQEKEKTGIASLKIRYNRVFGYYLEVTRANQDLVPERYIRKQTLANAERYVTPELKELEEQILRAEERQLELEAKLFTELREAVAKEAEGIRNLARTLAQLDCLAALAEVADRQRYVRPVVLPPGDPIRIEGGRHPVVEQASREPFVPNDVVLDEETQIILLTGPNMGGKSTYLRQVALIVLMAQAGSFVPGVPGGNRSGGQDLHPGGSIG